MIVDLASCPIAKPLNSIGGLIYDQVAITVFLSLPFATLQSIRMIVGED